MVNAKYIIGVILLLLLIMIFSYRRPVDEPYYNNYIETEKENNFCDLSQTSWNSIRLSESNATFSNFTPAVILNDVEFPDISYTKRHNGPAPGPDDQSEFMIGDVAACVIFPESDGSIDTNTEDWSDARKQTCIDEIWNGFNWWMEQEPNANLNLTLYQLLDATKEKTSYEPIARPSTDQNLWIGEILHNLGYTTGSYFNKVQDFNNDMREGWKSDWAYTIFVVDSKNDPNGEFTNGKFAYAYRGGPFLVMTYDNENWGISNMDGVAAHETGHIFYATDEYDDEPEFSGYLNVQDHDGADCIMNHNSWKVCDATRGQIGWKDSDGDEILDPIDTIPEISCSIYPYYLVNQSELFFEGSAQEVPLQNWNPCGPRNSISINHIQKIQYRVDEGNWIDVLPKDDIFNESIENFSFTTDSIPDGLHTIELRSQNSVGNWQKQYNSYEITIDITPPENPNTYTSDVDLSKWFSNDYFVLEWEGSNDQISGVDGYSLHLSEIPELPDKTIELRGDGPGRYNLTEGIWFVNIRTADYAGNWNPSFYSIGPIKIDRSQPNSFQIQTINNYWIPQSEPIFTFSTTDNISGIDHYSISIDNGVFVDIESPYRHPYLTDGPHTVAIRAYDHADNYVEVTKNFYIDSVPPEHFKIIASPSTWTNKSNITVFFSTVDNSSGIDHFEIDLDEGTICTNDTRYIVTNLRNGERRIKIRAYDRAGNNVEEEVIVFIDTEPPDRFFELSNFEQWFNQSQLNLTFSAIDNVSGISHFSIRVNGGPFENLTDNYRLKGLNEGMNDLIIRAYDRALNYIEERRVFRYDSVSPMIWSCKLIPCGWTTDTSPTLEFNISDNTSGVFSSSIRIGNYFSDNITSPFSVRELADGIHSLELISYDYAGNHHVELITIKIDLSQPIIKINRSIYKWFKENPGEIMDVDFYSGDGSLLTHAEYSINDVLFSFPDKVFDATLESFTTNWGISWSQLEEGENTISIRTFDEVGHSLTRNIFIYKDTMRPILKIKTKADVITSSDIKIKWAADDFISGIDYVLIKIDDAAFVNVGQQNEYLFTNTADGEHIITIRAVDKAGNIKDETIEIEVNTNIFSFSGPLYGAPTCGLFVSFLVILGVIFIKIRRKKNKSYQKNKCPIFNEDDLEDENPIDDILIDNDIPFTDENFDYEEGTYHDKIDETTFESFESDFILEENEIFLENISDEDLLDESEEIQTLKPIDEQNNSGIEDLDEFDDIPILIPIKNE